MDQQEGLIECCPLHDPSLFSCYWTFLSCVHSLSQSHKEMMEMKPEIKTDAECARFCVKERGGRFVLQIKEKVYKLDAQVLAEEWAGQKVKLTGTLDSKTNTITVEKIEALTPGQGSSPKPN